MNQLKSFPHKQWRSVTINQRGINFILAPIYIIHFIFIFRFIIINLLLALIHKLYQC